MYVGDANMNLVTQYGHRWLIGVVVRVSFHIAHWDPLCMSGIFYS